MRIKTYFILFIILLSSRIVLASDAVKEPLSSPEQILGFAQNLYDTGDYYRAITEYQRFIFLYPNEAKVSFARFQIGASYYAGDELEEAIKTWQALLDQKPSDKLRQETLYYLGAAHYKTGKYYLARNYMEKLQAETIDPQLRTDSQKIVIMSHVQQQSWVAAVSAAEKMPPPQAGILAAKVKEGENQELKSPLLAGVMSTFLPGAGQYYAGRTQDGVMAFVLNGLFIWGTVESFSHDRPGVGVILLFFESGWYFGNIYSATNSAHKYNNEQQEKYKRDLQNNLQFNLGVPQLTPIGLNISYKF